MAVPPFLPQVTKPIIVVVGPTASGKSDLSQQLALHYSGEVISADSMQIYRGMDIGTGKVMPDEMVVPHHALDIMDPGEPYSVALFQDFARRKIAELDGEGKTAVLCGGTGLYVRGVIDGFEYPSGEQQENPLRAEFTAYLEKHGNDALWELLNQRDPEAAKVVHPNNSRRVIRALELHAEGKSYADQKENFSKIPQVIPAIQIGLKVTPAILNARIDQRVDKMVESGLLDEVKSLLNGGFRDALTAPQAIGYKELVDYLEGRCSMDEAVEQIKIASHRYAKRQRSWFGRDDRIHWVDADIRDSETLLKTSIDIIDRNTRMEMERYCAHGIGIR